MSSKSIYYLKKSALFLFILFITKSSFAQFYHGLEIGGNLNNANFILGESSATGTGFGFNLGYMAERDLSENLYMRFAFLVNTRSIETINRRGINTSSEKWGLNVIEIPLNLGYYLNLNHRNFQFFVDAGLNIDYHIRAYTKNDTETITHDLGAENDIKRSAIGANLGVGLLLKKRFKVRLNYYNTLTNITSAEGSEWKNKTIGISINYFLKKREVY